MPLNLSGIYVLGVSIEYKHNTYMDKPVSFQTWFHLRLILYFDNSKLIIQS